MNARRLLTLIGTLAAAVALAADAGAAKHKPAPLAVSSSSLTQDGLHVVWSVRLAGRFSADGLAGERRALCLLIERAKTGTVAGQACIVPGPAPKHNAELEYAHVTRKGPGTGRIVGSVSRNGAYALTASFTPSQVGWSYASLRWQVMSTLRPPKCTPPKPNRVGCFTLFPAKPTLVKLHTPQVVGCVPSGSSLVFNGPSNVHDIALTFDDGPWNAPPTIDFVNLLAHYHVPATFFEIGEQINEFDPTGSIEKQMLADGDMIGDHTWTHPDMVRLSPSAQQSEIQETANEIKAQTGFEPCLWRPPDGAFSTQLVDLARSLGFLTINWDVDTRDWSLPGTSAIYNAAVNGAHDGAIIIQHFGGGPRYETYAAIPQEIATLRARGYRFVTVAQMLGLRLLYR